MSDTDVPVSGTVHTSTEQVYMTLLDVLLYNVGMAFEKQSIMPYLSIIHQILYLLENMLNNMPILK